MENVAWDDVQAFLERLNNAEKGAGWVYRLPTAAEWEYACRGGPLSDKSESAYDFYFDKPTNQLLPEQANVSRFLQRTCKVGSTRRIAWACTTCTATFGSGVTIRRGPSTGPRTGSPGAAAGAPSRRRATLRTAWPARGEAPRVGLRLVRSSASKLAAGATRRELLNEAIFGAIYYRLLLHSGPLTRQFGEELVEKIVLRGHRSANARS